MPTESASPGPALPKAPGIFDSLTKSWKTTLLGVASASLMYLQTHPEFVPPNLQGLAGTLLSIALLALGACAKDGDKSHALPPTP